MRGEGGSCGVSANENSCARHLTWSQNKLWRSNSVFSLCSWPMPSPWERVWRGGRAEGVGGRALRRNQRPLLTVKSEEYKQMKGVLPWLVRWARRAVQEIVILPWLLWSALYKITEHYVTLCVPIAKAVVRSCRATCLWMFVSGPLSLPATISSSRPPTFSYIFSFIPNPHNIAYSKEILDTHLCDIKLILIPQ